jgi:hypothetical protein
MAIAQDVDYNMRLYMTKATYIQAIHDNYIQELKPPHRFTATPNLPRHISSSKVNITKRLPIDSTHQIPNLPRLHAQIIRLDNIVQRRLPTRRVVVNRNRARHRARLVQMQGLPDPVHAVEHGVVHEEHGVVGTAVEIAGVAANGEVARGVQAQEALVETALELVLEGFDGAGGGA